MMAHHFSKARNPANNTSLKKDSKVFVVHQSMHATYVFEGEITRALKTKCGVAYKPHHGSVCFMDVDANGHKIELHRSSIMRVFIMPFNEVNQEWVNKVEAMRKAKLENEEASKRVMQMVRNIPIQSDKWAKIEELLNSLK